MVRGAARLCSRNALFTSWVMIVAPSAAKAPRPPAWSKEALAFFCPSRVRVTRTTNSRKINTLRWAELDRSKINLRRSPQCSQHGLPGTHTRGKNALFYQDWEAAVE